MSISLFVCVERVADVARCSRRAVLAGVAALLAACAGGPPAVVSQEPPPPIVFVHGNGDTGGLWLTTIWRFESNGWPTTRLHAIDLPYPLARDADDKPQPGRTSIAEYQQFLAAEVDRVLAATGARQVVLMANSRGGYAVRSFIANGGAAKVSHAILGGVPNHGIWANPSFRPTNEFNGAGPLLMALNNQGEPGVELTKGPKWMTIRSDANDKYAQPDGAWIGAKGTPTNVTVAGPELRGADNVVIPGIDHRETAFGPQAFAAAYRFITGRAPRSTDVTPQPAVALSGLVSGLGLGNDPTQGSFVTNLPLAGATLEVFAVDATTGERRGDALWRQSIGADGRWGPLAVSSRTPLEFIVAAPGYAQTHIYRSPFLRSSQLVNLRAAVLTDADRKAGAVVQLTRLRGYFGLPRNHVVLDGQDPAPGLVPGVAGVSTATVRLPPGTPRAVAAELDGERLVGRSWPVAGNHLVQLELHQ
ncbi:MAG: twin-arginine translocation pathway signal [Rubrivivax sp.]